MSPRLAAELERLRAEDDAREAKKAQKAGQQGSDSESFDEDEPDTRQRTKKLKSKSELLHSMKTFSHCGASDANEQCVARVTNVTIVAIVGLYTYVYIHFIILEGLFESLYKSQ